MHISWRKKAGRLAFRRFWNQIKRSVLTFRLLQQACCMPPSPEPATEAGEAASWPHRRTRGPALTSPAQETSRVKEPLCVSHNAAMMHAQIRSREFTGNDSCGGARCTRNQFGCQADLRDGRENEALSSRKPFFSSHPLFAMLSLSC